MVLPEQGRYLKWTVLKYTLNAEWIVVILDVAVVIVSGETQWSGTHRLLAILPQTSARCSSRAGSRVIAHFIHNVMTVRWQRICCQSKKQKRLLGSNLNLNPVPTENLIAFMTQNDSVTSLSWRLSLSPAAPLQTASSCSTSPTHWIRQI